MDDLTTARFHSIRCPFCEVYELERLAGGSAESGGSKGVSEAYLSGWRDGIFGSTASFVHNRELARLEDATDRLDYYRGHHAGRETFLGREEPRGADAA